MEGTLGRGQHLRICDLGTVPYRDALELQHELVHKRQEGMITDTLLLLEHPAVITQGRSADHHDILAPTDQLTAAGVDVVSIERGGETTYHGPGQLVGYPILDLHSHLRSLKKYVYLLEEVFVRYLAEHHRIEATRDPEHRGVWVGSEKITAIGVAVSRRVTFHGFAFNVNTDLSHFGWIIPCGITDRGQTSLAALTGTQIDMQTVKAGIAETFCSVYGYEKRSVEQVSATALINE
ncbi:MAG: lipoyl(octanoyl) transferase LipB [Alkalispirochaeta sp.]